LPALPPPKTILDNKLMSLDSLQPYWDQTLRVWREDLGLSDCFLFMTGSFLTHNITFWLLNGILFLFYRYDLFPKYRIRRSKYPDAALVKECLKSLVVSHLLGQWPVSYISYPLFNFCGMHFSRVLPNLATVAIQIVLFMLVEDTAFYWSHRMLHHPAIYKYIHKRHHEFKATIGIASEYAHPLEGIFSNVLPFMTGPLLVGYFWDLHVVTFWFWLFIRVVETTEGHCGYAFPFSPFSCLPFQGGPERHYFHHSNNAGSYGSFFNYWDKIMGTDVPFVEYQKKMGVGKKKL